MKKLLPVIITMLLLISCSSEDDTAVSIDIEKVLGKWFEKGYCEDQNNITFNEDESYIQISSRNTDCAINEKDTYRHVGSFNIINDDIELKIISSEKIIEGTILSVTEQTEVNHISTKIITLTDSTMVIETKYKSIDPRDDRVMSYKLDLIR